MHFFTTLICLTSSPFEGIENLFPETEQYNADEKFYALGASGDYFAYLQQHRNLQAGCMLWSVVVQNLVTDKQHRIDFDAALDDGGERCGFELPFLAHVAKHFGAQISAILKIHGIDRSKQFSFIAHPAKFEGDVYSVRFGPTRAWDKDRQHFSAVDAYLVSERRGRKRIGSLPAISNDLGWKGGSPKVIGFFALPNSKSFAVVVAEEHTGWEGQPFNVVSVFGGHRERGFRPVSKR